jgi:hypothetical protein
MADINVERKGPSIWPWIIGLLVLALLIWAVAEMVDRDDRVADTVETTVPAAEAPPPAAPPATDEFVAPGTAPASPGTVDGTTGTVDGTRPTDEPLDRTP